MSTPAKDPILVVGAGPQGLTMALALVSRGWPVVVAESSGVVGGQARSFRYGGFTFDLGLHALVSRDGDVSRFARDVLGDDFSEFFPRAATRLESGALIEDTSRWTLNAGRRAFYDLFPENAAAGWNCMLVSKPPPIIYPRRGGFGRLFERMAELLRERGGRILLNTPISPSDFKWKGDRLRAVSVGGERMAVGGCYWSVGSRLLAPPAKRRSGADGEGLVLFHFSVRGEPAAPFHWVRLRGGGHPFLPQLVHYPARFSPANAPAGHHCVGAVVPVPRFQGLSRKEAALWRWFDADPAAFLPLIQRRLTETGLLPESGVLEVHFERQTLPPDRTRRSSRHPYEDATNLWDSDRWLVDDPRDSGVSLQMAAAFRALDAVTAR